MAHQSTNSDSDDTRREKTADDRDRAADVREAALEKRESQVYSALAAQGERDVSARKILDEAERRDVVSDDRDAAADRREVAASRAAFLEQKHASAHQPEVRRAAALDRLHSKTDRASAASDRIELAGRAPAAGPRSRSND